MGLIERRNRIVVRLNGVLIVCIVAALFIVFLTFPRGHRTLRFYCKFFDIVPKFGQIGLLYIPVAKKSYLNE